MWRTDGSQEPVRVTGRSFTGTEADPQTDLKILFGIMAAAVALLIFAVLLCTITSNSPKLSKVADEHREHFRQLRRFLAHAEWTLAFGYVSPSFWACAAAAFETLEA